MFDYLLNELSFKNIPNKLEKYYLLTDNQFLKEIKKKNKNFEQNNVVSIFEETKRNIEVLNNEINIKNKKLNDVVYKIYNLNEKEIRIIEEEN